MGKREQPAFRCDLHVLKDVNLEVAEGEKLVIIGPSGSGKSTTVRCMNFLEEPTSGHVYIDGQELTVKNKTKLVRETTSMVFQQFNLYPHMTVLKNLTLAPMKLHHKTKQEAEELPQHKRHPLWIEQPMGDGRKSRPGCGLYKKRKSDDPCRWVIAFLVPCGTGRVNDKKVNEENSKVKNKGVCGAEFAAPK